MIIVFTGPPFAGKDTQAKLLASELNIPVFSMGAIIREAYEKKDPRGVEGFEKYSMKGLHVPIELKFDLLKDKINGLDSFMLDNFPANLEDIEAFEKYLSEKNQKVNRVVYLYISEDEMKNRLVHRGRGDDDPEIVAKRRQVQDEDRQPVIDYFNNMGILSQIDGAQSIDDVHKQIREALSL